MGGMLSTARDMQKYVWKTLRQCSEIPVIFVFSWDFLPSWQQPNPGLCYPKRGKQFLKCYSHPQIMEPAVMFNDGLGGFGLPWETNYTSNYWVYSVSPGSFLSPTISESRRVCRISIPDGCRPCSQARYFHFCYTGTSQWWWYWSKSYPFSDLTYPQSVWTMPMMDLLIPYFVKAVATKQARYYSHSRSDILAAHWTS